MQAGASVIRPLIEATIRQVEMATISFQVARYLIGVTIEAIVAQGWDKIESERPEALIARYAKHPYVVGAFRDNDLEDE